MRSTNTGRSRREPKTVTVEENAPTVRETSTEAPCPVSARSGPRMVKRDIPAASVSSVSGVVGKNPGPTTTNPKPL